MQYFYRGAIFNSLQSQIYVQSLKYTLNKSQDTKKASFNAVICGFPFYFFKQAKYMNIDINEQIKKSKGNVLFKGAPVSIPILILS